MSTIEPEQPHWFCIRSQQKHEQIAAVHLRKLAGMEVFCPRLRLKRPTRAGAKWFTEAMFPGYLFARFLLRHSHKEVQYTAGVAGILRFGDRYVTIHDDVIEGLRQHTDGQQLIVVAPDLAVGQEVKIVSGALCGLEAVVTRMLPGKERLRILLHFLGQQIEAEVQRDDLLHPSRHPLSNGGASTQG